MTNSQLAIIDAAIRVAAFSGSHTYPAEGTPEFFEFAKLLDRLHTEIRSVYPDFNRNLRQQQPNEQDVKPPRPV